MEEEGKKTKSYDETAKIFKTKSNGGIQCDDHTFVVKGAMLERPFNNLL